MIVKILQYLGLGVLTIILILGAAGAVWMNLFEKDSPPEDNPEL